MGILKGKAIATPEAKEVVSEDLEIDDVLALEGGEEEEQDLEANPNDRLAPIPPADYVFRLMLNPQKKISSKTRPDKPTSYTVPIVAIIDDKEAGELNGRRIDYWANTAKGMSPISRVAYLLKQMGILTSGSISQADQAKFLVAALKQEPKIKAKVDWEATYQVETGEGEDKKYITAKYKGKRLNTAENFPVVDGEPSSEVDVVDEDGNTRSVTARPFLADFYAKKQPVQINLSTKKVVAKEETEEEETPAQTKKESGKKKLIVTNDDV